MKTLLIGLTLLSSLTVFASETVSGIVMQAECNRPSGLGIVELQSRDGDTLVSTWYKVKSSDLCSSQVDNQMFLFKTAKLTGLGANNITFGANTISTFNLDEEGYITEMIDTKSIDRRDFSKGIKDSEQIGVREAHNWYFSEIL